MTTIRTRAAKGSALSSTEYDDAVKRTPVVKSSNYTLDNSHNREIHELGASVTQVTLPDVSASPPEVGDWRITLINTLSSSVTIARNGLTIDGMSSDLILPPGETITLWMNSTFNGFWTDRKRFIAGSQLYHGATQTLANNTWTGLNHNTVVYEHPECVAAGGSPTRTIITVPAGYSWIRIVSRVLIEANSTGIRSIRVVTGAGAELTPPQQNNVSVSSTNAMFAYLDTGWLSVTAADTFNVQVFQNSGVSLYIQANYTSTSVEFR